MTARERTQEITVINPGMRGLIAMAMLMVLWAAATLPAGAQTQSPPPARDYVSCGHFESQADAQEVLDSGNLDANGIQSLDSDGDGVACEDAFDDASEPSTAPATSVTNLPRTGSGTAAEIDGLHVSAVVATLLSIGALLGAWRQRVR